MLSVSLPAVMVWCHTCAMRLLTNEGGRVHTQSSKYDREQGNTRQQPRLQQNQVMLVPAAFDAKTQTGADTGTLRCLSLAGSQADVPPLNNTRSLISMRLRRVNYNGQKFCFPPFNKRTK
uniref:Secreted protein n=1 Tax=Eutreptiella gymnastica TaxID=73025 RepID=A0A6U7ZW73_9EUGL